MRSFSSAPRRRVAAAALAAALTCGLGTTLSLSTPASAKDLQDRQRDLAQRIESTRTSVDEASGRARRATAALESATAALSDARARLGRVEERVAAAAVRNTDLRAELAVSQERLATAQARLIAGRIEVVETRNRATETITSVYQGAGDPGLRTLSSFLSAGSLEEIEAEQQAEDLIVGRQVGAYDDVRAAEERLEATEAAVTEATDLVAAQQAEAARTVESLRVLRGTVVGARDRVLQKVQANRDARRTALAARARDQRALAQLRRQEAEVREKILAAQRRAERAGTGYTGSTSGLFTMPSGGAVSSPYGFRTHPIYGYYSLHDGVDFGGGCGAALRASAPGRVVSAYWSDVYGRRLIVDHGAVDGVGLATIYNHASSYTVGVGAQVARGQTIGYMGDSGWSTGCHLHFTVSANGRTVNPQNWF